MKEEIRLRAFMDAQKDFVTATELIGVPTQYSTKIEDYVATISFIMGDIHGYVVIYPSHEKGYVCGVAKNLDKNQCYIVPDTFDGREMIGLIVSMYTDSHATLEELRSRNPDVHI